MQGVSEVASAGGRDCEAKPWVAGEKRKGEKSMPHHCAIKLLVAEAVLNARHEVVLAEVVHGVLDHDLLLREERLEVQRVVLVEPRELLGRLVLLPQLRNLLRRRHRGGRCGRDLLQARRGGEAARPRGHPSGGGRWHHAATCSARQRVHTRRSEARKRWVRATCPSAAKGLRSASTPHSLGRGRLIDLVDTQTAGRGHATASSRGCCKRGAGACRDGVLQPNARVARAGSRLHLGLRRNLGLPVRPSTF